MSEYLAAATPSNDKVTDNLTEPNISHITQQENIRLLEEKLIVEMSKQKIGEVIVRKVIETQMVQVPVRREKLIIEQISPEQKQLAEIDLSQGEISAIELTHSAARELTSSLDSGLTISASFSSPKVASLLLNAIALERNHHCHQVQVSIVVDDEEHRQKYQEWFDRSSLKQES